MKRLEALLATLEAGSTPGNVSDADILQRRAQQYASVPPADDQAEDADTLTLLTFALNGEHYGIEAVYVQSVRPLPPVTRVPNAPPFYVGVINVRGVVVTLLDLSVFFGLGRATDTDELAVVEASGLTLGLPVRRITDVISVPRPAIHSLDDARYALGAYTHNDRRLIVLDIQDLFTDSRLHGTQHSEDQAE